MPDLEGLVTRVDTRPIQQLHSITTLEDIRTERLLSTLEAASHASKLPDIRTAPEKHATALDAIHQREAKVVGVYPFSTIVCAAAHSHKPLTHSRLSNEGHQWRWRVSSCQQTSPSEWMQLCKTAALLGTTDPTASTPWVSAKAKGSPCAAPHALSCDPIFLYWPLASMLHTSPLTTAATFASGVFEADQNEVRSRSMMRVSLRKELSTASMRLPQPQKHDPRAVRGPAAGHPAGGTRRISYAATQNVAGGGDRPGASSDATGDAASETSRSINLT
ncbi:hypothetical protein HaLaN_25006, partial [Haematococcus lacustris]